MRQRMVGGERKLGGALDWFLDWGVETRLAVWIWRSTSIGSWAMTGFWAGFWTGRFWTGGFWTGGFWIGWATEWRLRR